MKLIKCKKIMYKSKKILHRLVAILSYLRITNLKCGKYTIGFYNQKLIICVNLVE